MLGLFVSEVGLSICEADGLVQPPEVAASPHTGKICFRLVGVDAVVLNDGEPQVCAFYQIDSLGGRDRAIRPEPSESQSE